VRHLKIAALAGLIVIPLLVPAPAASQDDEKAMEEVKELRNKWIEAEEAKNIPFLKQILADEFTAVNAQGQVLDREHFLERMADPNRILHVRNPRDSMLHLYGNGTVAVLSEQVTVSGTDKGKPFGGEFRFVRIFAKQDGTWKVVLAQGTCRSRPLNALSCGRLLRSEIPTQASSPHLAHPHIEAGGPDWHYPKRGCEGHSWVYTRRNPESEVELPA
jgi:ketosteroid isomerase-like protein